VKEEKVAAAVWAEDGVVAWADAVAAAVAEVEVAAAVREPEDKPNLFRFGRKYN
jgi:sulfur transfer complex TusBCD TusB component (DsrH family)